MPIPPSMEMELMELGILKSDTEELESIAEQTGFYALRAETIAWQHTNSRWRGNVLMAIRS